MVSPTCSIESCQFSGRLGPVGVQVYRSPISEFRLQWPASNFIEMPQLQREVGVIRRELLRLAVVALGSGEVASLLEHMSALNVDCRVIWCETQRFLVQKGGLEVFLGVTGGIRVAKRPPLFANSTIEDD